MEDAKQKEEEKKAFFTSKPGDDNFWQKYVFWHHKARATSYCLLLDTF